VLKYTKVSFYKMWINFKQKYFHTKTYLQNFFKRHKRKFFLYTGLIIIIFILLVPPITYLYFAGDLKDKESIMNRGKTGLILLTRNGQPFFTFYQPKEIQYVSLSNIPISIQQAVISSEDKNFYTNPGFSIRGIGRALFTDIFTGKLTEGGSTITQELAKNAFLSSSKNFLRKYQELVLASELNRRFSKNDILEMYLNSVYFGEGAFGIENASEAYFGKHAQNLDLSESTLLIGLLPAPSALSPLSNDPQRAINKRDIILMQMLKDKDITSEQVTAAENEKPVYNPAKKQESNTLAPHFALFVRDQLIAKYGEERVIRDGFQVRTTLNEDYQKYAQTVVRNQVIYLKRNNASNGAAVVMDPKTGEILTMVGSYDWNDAKFGQTNMSIIPRQPGSSFKPIIYADALEKKLITPATILQDVVTTFPGNYKPLDFDKRFRGPVSVRRALANSLNIPAVEVMEKVGVQEGLNIAKKFGITTLGTSASQYGLSLVLGSGEVKLLDLTNAYATFANNGAINEPKSILEIKDKYGKSVDSPNILTLILNFLSFSKSQQSQSVVSQNTTFLISNILSDNRARAEEFGGALTISRTAAVKTGTTDNFRDALTIGYTPSLVVGVWVGNNDNTPMDNIAGSLGAAPIWRLLMDNFLSNTPLETFQQPLGVVNQTLCLNKQTYTEYFIAGTQPQSCFQPTPTISFMPSLSPTPTNKPSEPLTLSPTPIVSTSPTQTPIFTPTSTLAPTPITQPTTHQPSPTLLPTL